jgi:hypothetical protein
MDEEELGLAIQLSLREERERRGIMEASEDDWTYMQARATGQRN